MIIVFPFWGFFVWRINAKCSAQCLADISAPYMLVIGPPFTDSSQGLDPLQSIFSVTTAMKRIGQLEPKGIAGPRMLIVKGISYIFIINKQQT